METTTTTIALDDLRSIPETDRATLKELARNIFNDQSVSRSQGISRSVLLEQDGEFSYKLVAERSRNSKRRTVEESISALGLSEAAARKLVRGVKSKDYKRYHLGDVRYIADLIIELDPDRQKQAIDVVIDNRKNLYQVNKEDVVLFLLAAGAIGQYNLDLWYSGMIRTLQKLNAKLEAGSADSPLDPSQKSELKRKVRSLQKKTAALLDTI